MSVKTLKTRTQAGFLGSLRLALEHYLVGANGLEPLTFCV